ncbi:MULTISPECIES: MerR family transcriptional regulator [Tissierellales]|jgi:DNA-binding transcriptional MerR regulator|uniref:MerR family transcriptional regulator n=1 Tax=Acidilutibacter cellobiosedens TaxID=2507161 RepID=A0A410QFM8_9FIRM|nr:MULTISPECIES: MerR family transcriptional regulator [Tissierellales]MBE6083614.1 MerR family transcriptional regulator [Tissierellaceae bacterium]QAT62729.1 MerR family transcriptional regulator [Acidilutibacter cellobiosedens]SCL89715.1 Multidrug-efflux transporter 1 regulator [Sporanaerobacter sp. PP17-6a]
MFSKLLKIGELAHLNHISVGTLRHYDEIGLLKPEYVDPETNYRYYSIEQSALIDIIQFLKNFDFSLDKIDSLLNSSNIDLLYKEICSQKLILTEYKDEIDRKISLIQQFKESIDTYVQNKNKNELEILKFNQRRIYTYSISKNIYEMTVDEYEYYLREFKIHLAKAKIPLAYFNRVGSIMDKNYFINKQFFSNELFIFLPTSQNINLKTKNIPAGNYATYFCNSFEEELPALNTLYDLIKSKNLTVTGDYICEVVYEIPNKSKNNRKMFIRLQIPVSL